jgi:hypothetical protein
MSHLVPLLEFNHACSRLRRGANLFTGDGKRKDVFVLFCICATFYWIIDNLERLPLFRPNLLLKISHCTPRIGEASNVMTALERCRVGTIPILLTHTPLELSNRIIRMLFHPLFHLAFNDTNLVYAATQQNRVSPDLKSDRLVRKNK